VGRRFPYAIDLDVRLEPLEVIDVQALANASRE
jgi:hypothetical protein